MIKPIVKKETQTILTASQTPLIIESLKAPFHPPLSFSLPEDEFEFSFARSSGPGGQNVNKVNTKVLLRWNLEASPSVSLEFKEWLRNALKNTLTKNGEILFSSDLFRDQKQNKKECVARIQKLFKTILTPEKKRKKSKPSFSSLKRNKTEKKLHAEKKKMRRNTFD